MNITKYLGKILRPLGFSRYDAIWRRNGARAFDVFEMTLAPISTGVAFNFGVYFKVISQDTNPVESKCHIRSSLRGIQWGCNFNELSEEFDDSDELSTKISRVIEKVVIPWFDGVKTRDGFLAAIKIDPDRTTDYLLDAIKYNSLKLD